ncbi:unnamed protein product [Arctogadus glacialis]
MSVYVFRWGALLLCWSFCVSAVSVAGQEPNCDDYDDNNEIPQDREEGPSPSTPCLAADLPRWDKLFIALEDSHMRQNMLLDTLKQCCGGATSLSPKLEQLAKGACRPCRSPDLESACPGHLGQSSLRLLRGLLVEMREEEAALRERRMNATLQQLLQASRELSTHLQRLEIKLAQSEEADAAARPSGAGALMKQSPGGRG